MKMDLTRHGIIMIITLSGYILYPAALELFCGGVEAISWTEHLRQKYHNSVYWRKKFCQANNAEKIFARDDLKNGLARTRMVKNGSGFVAFTYSVVNSRLIELMKTNLVVDDKSVIFQTNGMDRIAPIIIDEAGNTGAIANLEMVNNVISYCVIDDQLDYRIIMNWFRDYAMVEITDDLMQRYVNTSANPLQNYEHKIAKVLDQHRFEGTCTNIVPNKFPFDFGMGDTKHIRN